MATILLQVAGSTIGAMVGGPVGAAVGQAIGAAAGSAIDGSLMARVAGGAGRTVEGPRLRDLDVLASTEGAPIPRVYGRARVGGQVIWATPIEEETRVSRERGRTKGAPRTTRVDYAHHANLAVGLCEGPIAFVRRVWADGRELDLSLVEMRVHRGSEDQAPDPLIVARGGGEGTPAYRGLAPGILEGRLSCHTAPRRCVRVSAISGKAPVGGHARRTCQLTCSYLLKNPCFWMLCPPIQRSSTGTASSPR